jgi:tetratricopeptide (TPR) repeat protein
VGDRVIVAEGKRRWQADSGQLLLDLDVSLEGGELALKAKELPGDAAESWFERGAGLEGRSLEQAREAYERALALDPMHVAARINLGRLLHESGDSASAERAYREGIAKGVKDPLLYFNLGVLLADRGRLEDAIAAYRWALEVEPRFADCHYNLALAYESAGNQRGAIRHMGEYRKLRR